MNLEYIRTRIRATRDLFRRRCRAPYPGVTRRPLVCHHYRGHEGPHAASPAIVWDDVVTGGHVHVNEVAGGRLGQLVEFVRLLRWRPGGRR